MIKLEDTTLLSTKEALIHLQICRSTLATLVKQGKLKTIKFFNKNYFQLDELNELLEVK